MARIHAKSHMTKSNAMQNAKAKMLKIYNCGGEVAGARDGKPVWQFAGMAGSQAHILKVIRRAGARRISPLLLLIMP